MLSRMENGVLDNPRVRRTISIHCSGVSWGATVEALALGICDSRGMTDPLASEIEDTYFYFHFRLS